MSKRWNRVKPNSNELWLITLSPVFADLDDSDSVENFREIYKNIKPEELAALFILNDFDNELVKHVLLNRIDEISVDWISELEVSFTSYEFNSVVDLNNTVEILNNIINSSTVPLTRYFITVTSKDGPKITPYL